MCEKVSFREKIGLSVDNWSVGAGDYKALGLLDVLVLRHPGQGLDWAVLTFLVHFISILFLDLCICTIPFNF